MKTVGLIGGLSWVSSNEYYKIINERYQSQSGNGHSAKILLHSVDFSQYLRWQTEGDWENISKSLAKVAWGLEVAGAEGIALCTNTLHKVSDFIKEAVNVPFLSIVDAVAKKLHSKGISRVALLGTRLTMEDKFYREQMEKTASFEVLVPSETDRLCVHELIFKELLTGVITAESRAQFARICSDLSKLGAQGIILGCTELGMLAKGYAGEIPLYDSTQIHCEAILDWMLN